MAGFYAATANCNSFVSCSNMSPVDLYHVKCFERLFYGVLSCPVVFSYRMRGCPWLRHAGVTKIRFKLLLRIRVGRETQGISVSCLEYDGFCGVDRFSPMSLIRRPSLARASLVVDCSTGHLSVYHMCRQYRSSAKLEAPVTWTWADNIGEQGKT